MERIKCLSHGHNTVPPSNHLIPSLTLFYFNITTTIIKEKTILYIGEAPIMQVTQVHDKNSIIQGRSPNVVKVIFLTISNCS